MITFNNLKQFSEILDEIALFWMTYLGDRITQLRINVNVFLQMWCVGGWGGGLKICICKIPYVLNG